MSYTLEENELIPAAVMRMAAEQIDLARHYLDANSEDLERSIHQTRQSLKRVRALLALVAGELGDKVFECEWTCYRDAGRLLGEGRDASAVIETLNALILHFSPELDPSAFASTRRFLADSRDARLRIIVEEEVLKKVSEMLVAARERVETWPLRRTGFKAFARGLRRTYRAGQEGLRTVVQHPSLTNFHEWRKPVKLLWHQLQVLTPVWPIILSAYAEELRCLSERLNNHHDLDTLRHAALQSRDEEQRQERQSLIPLIDRRCRELEAASLPIGERLYAERPGRFTVRVKRYWQVWRRGSATIEMSQADNYVEPCQVAGHAC